MFLSEVLEASGLKSVRQLQNDWFSSGFDVLLCVSFRERLGNVVK